MLTKSEPLRGSMQENVGGPQRGSRSFLSSPLPTRAFLRTFNICNIPLTKSQGASLEFANPRGAYPSFPLYVAHPARLLHLLQDDAVFLCILSSSGFFLCSLGNYASTVRQRHLLLAQYRGLRSEILEAQIEGFVAIGARRPKR